MTLGIPGNDFPGGKGESEHRGRPTPEDLYRVADSRGRRAMGMEKWDSGRSGVSIGERAMLERANEILRFA